MKEETYRVVIGLSVNKEDTLGFNDNGIVYHNLPYDKLVAVQQVFALHASALSEAMDPMVRDLLQMGVEAAGRKANRETPVMDNSPGAMR